MLGHVIHPDTKSLFRSKTFYANVLGAAAQLLNRYAGAPMPPMALVIAQTLVNLAVRLLTDSPASLTGR